LNIYNYLPGNTDQWLVVVYFFSSLILLLGSAEIISRIFGLQKEFSRKFIHIVVGLLVIIFSINIDSPQPIIFLSASFTLFNYLIQRFNLLPAMESDRKTFGTVYYPFSILFLAIFLWIDFKFIFIVVVLILAFADSAAAIVGQSSSKPIKYKAWQDIKSLQGNAAMFISSYSIIVGSYFAFPDLVNFTLNYSILVSALVISFAITISEAISSKGSDNISVSIMAGLLLHIFFYGQIDIQNQFIGATVFAAIFAFVSYKLRYLTLDGAISASLVAVLLYGFGYWKFAIPILVFFITSNILSKAGKNLKQEFSLMFEKSSKRDSRQVFANGGIAIIWVTIYHFYSIDLIYFLFVSSIAAANADTWATELGVLSKSKPRLITTFERVEKGRSGGITFIGSLAALIGSFLIALSGIILMNEPQFNFYILLSLTMAGFFASFVDSFLGASFQAQYIDPATKQITEKVFSTVNKANTLISGYKWLNNDKVNFLSILTAPLFYFLFSSLV